MNNSDANKNGIFRTKFFFCVFMVQDEVGVHKLAKKERGQYPAILTEQTWSIKDLLYGFRENSGHNGSCRAAKVMRSCPLGYPITAQRRIWFILTAHIASLMVNKSKQTGVNYA